MRQEEGNKETDAMNRVLKCKKGVREIVMLLCIKMLFNNMIAAMKRHVVERLRYPLLRRNNSWVFQLPSTIVASSTTAATINSWAEKIAMIRFVTASMLVFAYLKQCSFNDSDYECIEEWGGGGGGKKPKL